MKPKRILFAAIFFSAYFHSSYAQVGVLFTGNAHPAFQNPVLKKMLSRSKQTTAFNKSGTSSGQVTDIYHINWVDSLKAWADTVEIDSYPAYNADGTPDYEIIIYKNGSVLSRRVNTLFSKNSYPDSLLPSWPDIFLYSSQQDANATYNNGKWVNTTRDTAFKIDAKGNIIDFRTQKWDGNQWADSLVYTAPYVSDTIDSFENFIVTGKQWVPVVKGAQYYYKGVYTGLYLENWNGSAWVFDPGQYQREVYGLDSKERINSVANNMFYNKIYQNEVDSFYYNTNNEVSSCKAFHYYPDATIDVVDTFDNISWENFVSLYRSNPLFSYWYDYTPMPVGGVGFIHFQHRQYNRDSAKVITILKFDREYNANRQEISAKYYGRDSSNNFVPVLSASYDWYTDGYPKQSIIQIYPSDKGTSDEISGDAYQRLLNTDGYMTELIHQTCFADSNLWQNFDKEIIVYKNSSGINSISPEKGVAVYPVPVGNKLNINSTLEPIKTVEIFDAEGKMILTNSFNVNRCQMDVSDLKEGIYIIKVYTLNGLTCQKFIK